MRRVALIGIVALLAFGLAWWLSQRASGHAAPVEIPGSTAASPRPPEQLTPPAPTAHTREEVQTSPPVPAHTGAATNPTLHGTVVVLDETGAEFGSECGTLELTSWVNGMAKRTAIQVNDGTFEAPIQAGARFYPLSARFRDRDARPLVTDAITVPSDGCFEIRMRWRLTAVVTVRDARTGRDLPRIEIDGRFVPRNSFAFLPPSGHSMPIVNLTGDSPFTIAPEHLDGMLQANVLFVRADGYAWSSARFDARLGGQTFIELSPASALDLDIVRLDRSLTVRLTVTPVGKTDSLYVGAVHEEGRMPLDDLPAGKYVVSAISLKGKTNVVLATEEVELVERIRTHATLDLGAAVQITESATSPERATLSGRLVVPTAWKVVTSNLAAKHLGQATSTEGWSRGLTLADPKRNGDFDIFTWEFKNLTVGEYSVSSTNPPCSVEVELLPGGTSNVVLEVPPPADVTVRVVDSLNALDVPVKQVRWRWLSSNPTLREPWAREKRDGNTLTYNFRSPVGRVELSAPALELGFETSHSTADLGPGQNDVVLRLVRCVALRVALQDGAAPVLLDMGQKYDVSAVEGDGAAIEWSPMENGETVARVSKPGLFRIALRQPLAGYLRPAEQIVNLLPGTMTDVVIRLTKKP